MPKGCSGPIPAFLEKGSEALASPRSSSNEARSSSTSSLSGCLHRRIDDRMGSSDLRRSFPPGNLVRSIIGDTHQYPGTDCNVHCPEEIVDSSKLSYKDPLRQLDSSCLSQSERIIQITSPQQLDDLYPSDHEEEESDSLCFPHSRDKECTGGRSISPRSDGHRMVPGQDIIQPHMSKVLCSRGRSLRHSGEPQGRDLSVSRGRLDGGGHGCSVPRLEQMGINLPPVSYTHLTLPTKA